MASLTGNGTTVVLSTGTHTSVGRVISIGEWSRTLDAVDDNCLETVKYDEFIPGDTWHHGPVTMDVVYDADTELTLGEAHTMVITFPSSDGVANGAEITGTGFLVEQSFTSVANNERIEGTVAFQYDGKTGPTFVAEVPPEPPA